MITTIGYKDENGDENKPHVRSEDNPKQVEVGPVKICEYINMDMEVGYLQNMLRKMTMLVSMEEDIKNCNEIIALAAASCDTAAAIKYLKSSNVDAEYRGSTQASDSLEWMFPFAIQDENDDE